MSRKLTQARIEMLTQLKREPGYYASYYPPLRWALEKGLAEDASNGRGDWYRITDAGVAALARGEA